MTPRASGSPRGRPRGHLRGNLAASVTSEDEDEQEAAEEELREEQAATLVQSLQQLEQVVVAGESLCRSVNSLPPYWETLRLAASLHTASEVSSRLLANNACLQMQLSRGVRVTMLECLLFVLAEPFDCMLMSA